MRRLLACTAAVLLSVGTSWVGAPGAAAAVTDGKCTDDSGVTLVVDHQDLGGGIITKCVTDVAPGTSGLEILQLAGLTPEGTLHDGPSFVCRIGGRPGVNETLPITSDPTYRERCGQTPPETAFWSYWHASNGGKWTFSQTGATSHEAILGGYEGWSFSLNGTKTSNPQPGVKPSHPVAQPPSKSADPTVAPPAQPKPKESAEPAKPSKKPTAATSSTAKPKATPSAKPASVAPKPPTPTATLLPTPTPTPSPSSTPSPSPSPSPSPEVTPSAAPNVSAVEAPAGGIPVGTIVGVGAVAVLGAGGTVVWWRRRTP